MKERIYEIRGQRVILDSDLSEIYGYTTKAFNQQVKNNIEKFDEDFMFELTDDDDDKWLMFNAKFSSADEVYESIYRQAKSSIYVALIITLD